MKVSNYKGLFLRRYFKKSQQINKDMPTPVGQQQKTEQDEFLDKLNAIVTESGIEMQSVVQTMANAPQDVLTTGERLADKVAAFGGSWKFIILFGSVIIVWIIANITFLGSETFDPYPFILLNLVLSCLAALQAPIIMMSQNRQASKDRKQADSDAIVNLKAEIAIRKVSEKVDLLMKEQMSYFFELEKKQLDMLNRLEKHAEFVEKNLH